MNQITRTVDTACIVGWGVDADRDNDPTWPMRDRSAQERSGAGWISPAAQHAQVEVLQSIEYDRRPAVVGTSTPPSGVSGAVRRLAFRWSESDWTHWLMLLGADRINMVEGILDDLRGGKIPNIPGEMGIRAELQHNKLGLVRKLAVTGAVGALFYGYTRWRKASARA